MACLMSRLQKTSTSDWMAGLAVVVIASSMGWAQSSSLYLEKPNALKVVRGRTTNPVGRHVSYSWVAVPEQRVFLKEDLLTILIKEQTSVKQETTLETGKDFDVQAGITALPHLQLVDLLNGKLRKSNKTTATLPAIGASGDQSFSGEGSYEDKATMSTRLGARVVDVKPNGTLAIEARTHIRHDDEAYTVTVTGYCRSEDVTLNNTILSAQIFDLRVNKVRQGELRRSSQKGWLTRLFEWVGL